MPLTVVWHELDTRHHSGDLTAGGTTIKGAVTITLRGGRSDVRRAIEGKDIKKISATFH